VELLEEVPEGGAGRNPVTDSSEAGPEGALDVEPVDEADDLTAVTPGGGGRRESRRSRLRRQMRGLLDQADAHGSSVFRADRVLGLLLALGGLTTVVASLLVDPDFINLSAGVRLTVCAIASLFTVFGLGLVIIPDFFTFRRLCGLVFILSGTAFALVLVSGTNVASGDGYSMGSIWGCGIIVCVPCVVIGGLLIYYEE
jgi:hypothetical protein